jgi:hypothetical protein
VCGEEKHHGSRSLWHRLLTSWQTGCKERGKDQGVAKIKDIPLTYFLQLGPIYYSFFHLPK